MTPERKQYGDPAEGEPTTITTIGTPPVADGSGSLPYTGFEGFLLVYAGIALVLLGVSLRRLAKQRRR